MIKTVLWDLDGTVLDSRPGVFHSIEYALEKLSLPIPSEQDRMGFLGPPIDIGFSQICHVPQEQVEEAIRLYREYYTQCGMFEAEIYQGVTDVLQWLRQEGASTFVTTSKPQVYAERILDRFDVSSLFDGIYGAELDGSRSHKAEVLQYCMERHEIDKASCVLIGDRMFDVNGAKQLGIPCVGVLYGYGEQAELEKAGATHIADMPLSLKAILSSLY